MDVNHESEASFTLVYFIGNLPPGEIELPPKILPVYRDTKHYGFGVIAIDVLLGIML